VILPAFAAERRAAALLLLSAGACYRSISPARTALSSKLMLPNDGTDGRPTVSKTLLRTGLLLFGKCQ